MDGVLSDDSLEKTEESRRDTPRVARRAWSVRVRVAERLKILLNRFDLVVHERPGRTLRPVLFLVLAFEFLVEQSREPLGLDRMLVENVLVFPRVGFEAVQLRVPPLVIPVLRSEVIEIAWSDVLPALVSDHLHALLDGFAEDELPGVGQDVAARVRWNVDIQIL